MKGSSQKSDLPLSAEERELGMDSDITRQTYK